MVGHYSNICDVVWMKIHYSKLHCFLNRDRKLIKPNSGAQPDFAAEKFLLLGFNDFVKLIQQTNEYEAILH